MSREYGCKIVKIIIKGCLSCVDLSSYWFFLGHPAFRFSDQVDIWWDKGLFNESKK